MAGKRIDCPDSVRDAEVQHSVDHERGGFDVRGLMRLKGPGKRQVTHVLWIDLVQFAVTLPVVCAVVLGPTVCRWIEEHGIVYPLPQKSCASGEQESTDQPLHW